MLKKTLLALASTLTLTSLAAPASAWDGAPTPYYHQAPAFGPIEVLWGGSWYAAELLDRRGESYLIRYQGWSSAFDEWVGADRIRKPPSALSPRVHIQWGGSWYPGRIVKQDGYRYLVTYDGWSSFFDEWVDDSRLRFERAAYVPTYRPLPTRHAPTYQKPVKHQRPHRRYR